jgi:hypothetical protein
MSKYQERETKPIASAKLAVIDGTAFAGGLCRCLIVGTAGVVNLTLATGEVLVNFPLTVGINPIKALAVNAPGAGIAAVSVWAGY